MGLIWLADFLLGFLFLFLNFYFLILFFSFLAFVQMGDCAMRRRSSPLASAGSLTVWVSIGRTRRGTRLTRFCTAGFCVKVSRCEFVACIFFSFCLVCLLFRI